MVPRGNKGGPAAHVLAPNPSGLNLWDLYSCDLLPLCSQLRIEVHMYVECWAGCILAIDQQLLHTHTPNASTLTMWQAAGPALAAEPRCCPFLKPESLALNHIIP